MGFAICGMPRSGTSLLYMMMKHALPQFYTFPDERKWHHKYVMQDVITKRPRDVFNHDLDVVKFVCVRDPRAAFTSYHVDWNGYFYRDGKELLEFIEGCIKDLTGRYWYNRHLVRYEQLIRNPDFYQKRWRFLDFQRPMKDFYQDDVPPKFMKMMNGKRPLDNGHNWREHADRILEHADDIAEACRLLGYEADDTWLTQLRSAA